MAKRRSLEERLEDAKQQQRKLQAQLNKKKRNERTKRLIELGATVESALEREIHKEELEELHSQLRTQNADNIKLSLQLVNAVEDIYHREFSSELLAETIDILRQHAPQPHNHWG